MPFRSLDSDGGERKQAIMIGLQKGMGPCVQTTTWLHELACGHQWGYRYSWSTSMARCQYVLVLPLVLDKCWITFWKIPSNHWGQKEYNGKKSMKLQIWEQAKDKGDRLLLTARFLQGILQIFCCQVPGTWLPTRLENLALDSWLEQLYWECT